MKPLYGSQIIREADQKAFSSLHVSGTTLMENAGKNATEQIIRHFPEVVNPLILVGPGNNGGDGLVIARHFLVHGITPSVILSRKPDRYSGETLENLRILQEILPEILCSEKLSDSEIDSCIHESDVVVDALLGTGATGTPRGEVLRMIQRLPSDHPIVSIDLPSGIDSTTGQIGQYVVKACMTLTLLASKPGLHAYPGAGCAGKVMTCDIGIPPSFLLQNAPSTFLVDRNDLSSLLPQRPKDIHKGKRGNLLIIGGSTLFRGAMALACRGALRAGAGVVVAAVPEQIASDLSSIVPEAVVFPIPSQDGYLRGNTIELCLEKWGEKHFQALVLGPGLGRTAETANLTFQAWTRWKGPLLVDADGLFALSHPGAEVSLERRSDAVLTPHEGEAGRLLGVVPQRIRENRIAFARKLSLLWGTILLKGPGSVIDDGQQNYILGEGHPCLAVPGSGDVLSGAIGTFLAAGIPAANACLAGSLLHATAGSLIGDQTGCDGTLAREISDVFPRIISLARKTGTVPQVHDPSSLSLIK